jgi:hypothetical protein
VSLDIAGTIIISDLLGGKPVHKIQILGTNFSRNENLYKHFNGANLIALSSQGLIAVCVSSKIFIYSINAEKLWEEPFIQNMATRNSDEHYEAI